MNSFFARRYVITGIFITVALILLARLFYMQIIDDRYLLFAKNNVVRPQIVYPARGPILDRRGVILVGNQPVYDVMITPKLVKAFDTLEFCRLIGIDKEGFDKRYKKAYKHSPRLQSVFEGQLSTITSASLQERMYEFPGFDLVLRTVRSYPDSSAAQFLGYIGEVNDARIAKSGGYYRQGDYIGISGVESSYEPELRGTRGVQNLMVDSRGAAKGHFADGAYDTAAVAGERLTSSLDSRIQKLGERLMANKVGSIVAIEPSTGEILCFVSSPTYNPNQLVGRQRSENYSELNQDPYKPFLVRPIQARYQPGSSFKPLDALIAIQEGVITPQTTYNCPGYYIAGNRRIQCFHGEVHGTVNLASAVAHSCNGYFFMVFEKLINQKGPKYTDTSFTLWRDKVLKFGIARKLNIDLPGENSGFLATSAFYDKWYKRGGWRSSTVISLGIGQSEILATPLQLANIEATIANRGFFYKPHLIKSIGDKQIIKKEYTERNYVGIDSGYFAPVIDGMQAVVERGTAVGVRIPGIIMCGKTGTAQTGHGEDNSVFVAFAPRDNPKIAIAVVVEHGGQGATWAAPIASFIVEKYLRDSISRRPSGITPDYYMNKNLLPAIVAKTPPGKKPSADSLKKAAVLDSLKKLKQKQVAAANKKAALLKQAAMLYKHKGNE
ncbi:MAG: penicillin-binding protein 2 [Bacteroidota bacterium]